MFHFCCLAKGCKRWNWLQIHLTSCTISTGYTFTVVTRARLLQLRWGSRAVLWNNSTQHYREAEDLYSGFNLDVAKDFGCHHLQSGDESVKTWSRCLKLNEKSVTALGSNVTAEGEHPYVFFQSNRRWTATKGEGLDLLVSNQTSFRLYRFFSVTGTLLSTRNVSYTCTHKGYVNASAIPVL